MFGDALPGKNPPEGGAREAWVRLAKIVACCVLLLALVYRGLWSAWRPLTLLTLGAVFSAAAFYELASREMRRRGAAMTLILIWVGVGISYWLLNHIAPPQPRWTGPLIAANQPTPPNACDGQLPHAKNALLMIFGHDAVIGRGGGPFTPIQIGTCPALTFRREAGGLTIDAFGYDSDGNVIYRVERNIFAMILGGWLKAARPDKSTLAIVDGGQETLAILYLNANTVKVRGTFRCGDTPPVRIGDSGIAMGKTPVTRQICGRLDAGQGAAIRYAAVSN